MNYKTLQEPLIPNEDKDGFVRNFTTRYLLPQIELLDPKTINAMNDTLWKAFGIADYKYKKYSEYDNKLFCLASTEQGMQYWLDNEEYYLYKDGKANKMMVILELPVNNRGAFLEGRYSDLYDRKTIKEIMPEYVTINDVQYPSVAYGIVTKTEQQRESFQKRLNEDFDLDPQITVASNQEYDYPPVLKREIFNYA